MTLIIVNSRDSGHAIVESRAVVASALSVHIAHGHRGRSLALSIISFVFF